MKIGTEVNVLLDNGTQWRTRTRSEPWQLGGGHWVVSLDGMAGGYALDRVTEAWPDMEAPRPMSELTREQIETILNEGHFYTRGDVVDRDRLLSHDAQQRAEIEALSGKLERLQTFVNNSTYGREMEAVKKENASWKLHHDANDQALGLTGMESRSQASYIIDLRAECDEYKRKYELVINDSAYGECCEIRAKAEAERDALKQQLCDSQKDNKFFQRERDEARSDRNNAVIDLYRKLDKKDLAITDHKQQLAAREAQIQELEEALKGVLREAVILSEDYLSAFLDKPMDATIQGWDKARWLRALAASKVAKQALCR